METRSSARSAHPCPAWWWWTRGRRTRRSSCCWACWDGGIRVSCGWSFTKGAPGCTPPRGRRSAPGNPRRGWAPPRHCPRRVSSRPRSSTSAHRRSSHCCAPRSRRPEPQAGIPPRTTSPCLPGRRTRCHGRCVSPKRPGSAGGIGDGLLPICSGSPRPVAASEPGQPNAAMPMSPPLQASDVAPAPAAPVHPALEAFHPLVATWFSETLGEPTEPQLRGWPRIAAGEDVLITAPTGSGKTLTAFLSALDTLFREALEGTLADATRVVYVSPLKALGNDVQKNLIAPLEALLGRAHAQGLTPQPIRVGLRTGDTPASERARQLKHPPHLLITTPESLYLALTAEKSRERLRTVETVIVDEIHALAPDRRGSHLALSLQWLEALVEGRLQRVGLSATVRPAELVARFLTGRHEGCHRVEVDPARPWELTLWTPDRELGAVASHEMWGEAYALVQDLSRQVRTILVFVNTRRLAERVAHDLAERMGEGR